MHIRVLCVLKNLITANTGSNVFHLNEQSRQMDKLTRDLPFLPHRLNRDRTWLGLLIKSENREHEATLQCNVFPRRIGALFPAQNTRVSPNLFAAIRIHKERQAALGSRLKLPKLDPGLSWLFDGIDSLF